MKDKIRICGSESKKVKYCLIILGHIKWDTKKKIFLAHQFIIYGNDIELTNKTVKEMANKLNEFHRTQPPEGLLCHDASYLKATFEKNNKKIEACVGIVVCKGLKCYFSEHWSLINRQRFVALIHRDLRLGNMIFDDNNQMYLIDFESCAIGEPLMDLMKIYIFLDKVNTVSWCLERNRTKD